MNQSTTRNSLLAALALAGLAVYILACSGPSFSPDDSKIAFPAFDPQSGELGVSVLDRKSGRVETAFTMSVIKDLKKPDYGAQILRPQWLDNNRLIIGWPGVGNHEKGLNVMVLPVGGKGAARLWQIPELGEMQETLIRPLAVAGSGLFMAVESNLVARLDLETGRVVTHACRGESIQVYASGREDFVLYVAPAVGAEGKLECGKLDPATFAQTPVMQMDITHFDHESPLAFSGDGKQVALVSEQGGKCQILLVRAGQAERTIPVATKGESLAIGGLCFSAKGDKLFASFLRGAEGETNQTCGLLGIPLEGGPAQRTVLFTLRKNMDNDMAMYLQPGVSRDGKTVAMCSTFLFAEAQAGQTTDPGCALFLIDVSKTPHVVSKVPLALPKEGHSFK